MKVSLGGRRVLVTGGAAGIGLAIATECAASGAMVHVCDVDAEGLDRFRRDHPEIGASLCDVGDAGAVDRLVEDAARGMGGLDVLVNNAGISGPMGPVEDIEPAEWDRVFRTNMSGTFHCTRRAVPWLRQAGGGAIINIGSAAGHLPYALRTPYASSKWAIVGFTLSLAVELGPDAIRVNAIMPGIVTGARRDRNSIVRAKLVGTTPEALEAARLARVAMQRAVDPEEVAAMAVFLACDHARSVSGQILGVDGYVQSLSGPGGRAD